MAGTSSAKTRFALLPGHDGNTLAPFTRERSLLLLPGAGLALRLALLRPGRDGGVGAIPRIQTPAHLLLSARATSFNRAPGRNVMAKGQMRSNKEKKKPKADKNIKKGGATPSPFSSGKIQMQAGQSPNSKK
jgi:hypothetical protein